jgi:hypothetical protein
VADGGCLAIRSIAGSVVDQSESSGNIAGPVNTISQSYPFPH